MSTSKDALDQKDSGRDYQIAWQSKISSASGVDDRFMTVDEAMEELPKANARHPNYEHFIVKKKK